jgi:type 1 glutamine amidotransferase
MRRLTLLAFGFSLLALFVVSVPQCLRGSIANAGEPKKRILLLWQKPDGHPKNTHEYELGQKILKRELDKFASLDAVLVNADDPWKDGPDLLAKADGVVLFVSEGARWLSADAKRLAAFQAAAKRKIGLSVLHWGMGTKDADNIKPFALLFGGCHGGPDRKYKVLETDAFAVSEKPHPIQNGLSKLKVRDEFYYSLKFPKGGIQPILQARIDGEDYTVAWAYPRDDGGRSFGFSGLHFHENWQLPEYRRLVTQGVLWTLNVEIPKGGITIK